MNKENLIDFVVLWVDEKDIEWQKQFMQYRSTPGDARDIRFRDTNTLQYWFRGVERYAPWVNNVYFVTCGQAPVWLNKNHPKLKCVNHEDFMPGRYLPTFSSHAIELNLHRICGLQEQFVYFNDDMFIMNKMSPNDFFKHGLPADSAVMNCFSPVRRPLFLVPIVNNSVINNHFEKKNVLRTNWRKFYSLKYGKHLIKNIQFIPGKYFPGFKWYHLPTSFLKSSFDKVWSAEPELLENTCMHKFRVLTDVNQWLVQDWQRCEGLVFPRKVTIGKHCQIDSDESLSRAIKLMRSSKYKMLCLNDDGIDDFDKMKSLLISSFEKKFPDKSSFEI